VSYGAVLLAVAFEGGREGQWQVERHDDIVGEPLPPAAAIRVVEGQPGGGVTSLPAKTRPAWSGAR
jgi:hypothetical protein